MRNKNLIIVILAGALIIAGIGNIILGVSINRIQSYEDENVLRIACSKANSPAVLDPVDSWDSGANDMIRHVCDTLWEYDLTDPAFPIKMRLATNYSWNSGMDELTVSLRENVWFHDGSKFNATAVKFTFDRIMYFSNYSGDLPGTTHVCDPADYFFDMYNNPIINQTGIIDEYTVRFVLYEPNGIFLSLLTYEACSILHPNSVDATNYLVLGIDRIIGTGPFKYIHLIAGEELRLDRWKLYWGNNVFWDRILWDYYPDRTSANDAFLDDKADYIYNPLNSYISTYKVEEEFNVVELDTSRIFMYWGINNRKINNSQVRKAIAYAVNYSYFIEDIFQGHVVKVEQMLPLGFPYYNTSFKSPYYNTSIARQAMLDAAAIEGWSTAGLTAEPVGYDTTNDANWADADFVTYTVQESEGWITGILMNIAMQSDMDAIGIEIVVDVWDWESSIWSPPYNADKLELFYDDWSLDYLDPFNIFEPLLSNSSSKNLVPSSYSISGQDFLQHNDVLIHQWLEQYEETDPANTTRKAQLLYKIQQRAINELYVLVPLGFDKTYYVHHRSLGEVGYNIMGKLWLADSYYIPNIPTI